MLKIKDNVDLKELKYYGFKKIGGIYANYYEHTITDNGYGEYIILDVDEDDRIIRLGAYTDDTGSHTENLDIIYDLIKDGLVEKVEE